MSLTGKHSLDLETFSEEETQEKMPERCRPDYQKMAGIVKTKFDSIIEFRRALLKVLEESALPSTIKNNEFNIFELNGALDIYAMYLSKQLTRLLDKIELERADGSSK